MKKRVLMALTGAFLCATQAFAQPKTVTGKVTTEQGATVPGASVVIKGTNFGTTANNDGNYSILVAVGQTLQFRFIGTKSEERVVGAENVINVQLKRVATNLNEVVVSALGQTTAARSLGTAQQSVQGADIAATFRENFVNALQGRVAGVEVTSSSGVPGSSSSITIRGVSSISSSNQPLMIIDGLPMDNKTLNTNTLASDANSLTAFNNRGIDFTNRAADINSEDIESMVILKGPEASALYGIDAANGAIVITTKRGSAGSSGWTYSNNFKIENTRSRPEVQRVYGRTNLVTGAFSYFGRPYADTTTFYDNIDGFFRTAVTQKHDLSFSGGTQDNKLNYRLALADAKQEGVVPGTKYDRINITGASGAQIVKWLKADVTMQYAYAANDQTYKGENGPLIGLLLWPATDNAKDYLTPAGNRRRLTTLSQSAEIDNPYFNLKSNGATKRTNRLIANVGFVASPFSWGNLKTNFGVDTYTDQNVVRRHPESAAGINFGGTLDQADDITRNINAQTVLNFFDRKITNSLSISGLLGNQISDAKSTTDALKGQDFLDPNFVSINNTNVRTNKTTLGQRRLLSGFGSATLNFKNYLYVTATGRNDWTSTIPKERNSFFYPSVSTSFIFSDAFPSIGNFMTGKVRAAYAEVGKDARPYAFRPSLEYKTTSNGGYGYGFTGPNLALKPEFATSYEFGTELGLFHDRVGLDVTTYRKQTRDQIVNDIRGSYATGYILFNLNGAVTRNEGVEATLRFAPVVKRKFSWDVLANFEKAKGTVLALPNALPESYVSDTWLFGNVRNGTAPGLSTRSLTGLFYLRNTKGDILVDPTNGLPIRSPSLFIDGRYPGNDGYNRQPDWTLGLTNTFRYKRASLNFLLDFRKGGDVFNATEHYLTTRGLSMQTLDRDVPRVVKGVLRDGKENSATPTPNNIVVIPAVQNSYYTLMSEELFIEKDINWMRLRDVKLNVALPGKFFGARDASIYISGTDLFLITNYSGLDPIVNGNSAAVGGSGATGIDFGNFPMPRGFSLGFKVGY